jgi:hypothetical protein
MLPRMQRILFDSDEGVLKGRLYPEAEKELGKISWSCKLEAGLPEGYEIVVDRGKNQFWVLEISRPWLQAFSDDDVLKYILWKRLYNGWWAYLLVQRKNHLISPESVNRLIRNEKGNVTGFQGVLTNGQALTGDLSDGLEPSNILVDGKADTCWSDICAQENLNIDKLYQLELNQSRRFFDSQRGF